MYEPYLAHYGVKGMKWGVRKSRDSGISRRENRRRNKKAEQTFYKKKGEILVKEAAKRRNSVMLYDSKANLLMTGQDFINELMKTNGVFNPKYTDIVATKVGPDMWDDYTGPGAGRYQKRDFRSGG